MDPHDGRPLSRIFKKIRLADHIFRLIFGLAEFTRKLKNSAGNTAEHYKIRLTFKLYTVSQKMSKL